MTIQHLNDSRAIARVAQQVGATLPKRIASAVAHLEQITTATVVAPRPGTLAAELAKHLGDATSFDKAKALAVAQLAASEADAKISQYLTETCGTRLLAMLRGEREAITAAIGAALAPDLDALQANAGKLPPSFNPDQAGGLDPATFKSWVVARDAYARIAATQLTLDLLYGGAADRVTFPTQAAASLRYAKPGPLNDPANAYAFRDALMGKAVRVQGVAGQGSTYVDGLFIPATIAHAGGSFEWGTPTEVTERARRLVGAMTVAA